MMRRGMQGCATRQRCAIRVAALLMAMTLLMGAMPRPDAAASAGSTPGPLAAAPNGPAAFALPWTPLGVAHRVYVATDGLYALTYSDLAAANLPVDTLDPRSLRMYAMGQEIPLRVLGEADGHFDASDVALFYGRSVDSLFLDGILPTNKYTGTNVYFLTYTCAVGPCAGPYGLRMAEPDGTIAGSAAGPFLHRDRVGRDFWYFSAFPFLNDVDHWYADWVTLAVPRTYSVNMSNLPAGAAAATLKVDLLGWSNYPHHLMLWVNNNLVQDGSVGWGGFNTYTLTVSVPSNYLIEGSNKIKVGIVLDAGVPADTIYLNWVDISYYDDYVAENGELAFRNDSAGAWRYDVSKFTSPDIEVYDTTDWLAPQRMINTTVSGAGPNTVSFGDTAAGPKQYLAVQPSAWKKPAAIEAVSLAGSMYQPADLLSTSNSADYILISHRSFWTQAAQLAAHRDADWRIALVDVQQVYDQFNGGVMSAEAIHDFLAYAHAHWRRPAPMYVLLMGDGTNDMRNNRTTTKTYIPPYLYLADPDLGETAAENRFVTLEGNDNIPDMHIGRFPVNTPAEAQAMVDKTINYEKGCSCNGVWDKHTLFVADDLEGGGGDFYAYSDKVADGFVDAPANTVKLVPPSYTIDKKYLGQTCDVIANPTDAVQCRNQITSTLNITGSLFMSYVGHSTKEYWAVEHLFDKAAVGTLTNGPCLPIILAMTCYEGSFFDYSTPEVLAEASVRKPVSGAVASWSPTGFGLVSGHDYLEQGIFLAWFHKGIYRLGEATTYAKQYLVDVSPPNRYLDLLDTFALLGDPGLIVKTEEVCLTPTGVVATSFTAAQEAGAAGPAVQLAWQTADESEIVGFNVLRRLEGGGAFVPLNAELLLAEHAGLNRGGSYSYRDGSVGLGRSYEYTLQIVKSDGSSEEYGSARSRLSGVRFFLPFAGR